MRYIGNFMCFVGVFLVVSGFRGNTRHHGSLADYSDYYDGSHRLMIPIGIVLVLIGYFASKHSMQLSQEKEDSLARSKFHGDDFQGHSIFLRPFDVEGRYTVETDYLSLDAKDYVRIGGKSLERSIADAVKSTSPMIGLGSRGDIEFGFAAGGYLDDGWQKRIASAIATADFIFLIPSSRSGTLWEIGEILRQEMLQKTVFIMPRIASPVEVVTPVETRAMWEKAREALYDEYGLVMPEYRANGAFFRMKNRSAMANHMIIEPSFFESPNDVVGAINSIMQE